MRLPDCEIERNAKLTAFEKACAGLALMSPLLGLMAVEIKCGG